MRSWLCLLCLASAAGVAWAAPPGADPFTWSPPRPATQVAEVCLRVDPPGARVRRDPRSPLLVGDTQSPLLDPEHLAIVSGRLPTLTEGERALYLVAPGYHDAVVIVPAGAFSSSRCWPPGQAAPVRLVARYGPLSSVLLWASLHSVAAGLLGALALAGGGEAARRAQRQRRERLAARQRAERLARLGAAGGTRGPLSGRTLGSWCLLDLVGEGASAHVYRAMPAAGFDASQDAAVKVMRDEAVRAPGFWRRFRGERDALLALRHRHVALVLDMGEDGGVPYMAFEWVGGGDLRRQLAQGRLATGRALRWLLEITSAVEHAHGKGLLHGDIKPANVLLRDDGAACLADFGLATLVTQQDVGGGQPTRGTLGYMAPEQLDGAAASPASDQYALGVMGYEMLAGKAPFGSGEVIAVLHRQLAGDLQPLRELDPSLPEGPCGVVERMMARRAEDRFASVAEALRALEASSDLHREDEARG